MYAAILVFTEKKMKRQNKTNLMKVDLHSCNKQQILKWFLMHMVRATAKLLSEWQRAKGTSRSQGQQHGQKLVC